MSGVNLSLDAEGNITALYRSIVGPMTGLHHPVQHQGSRLSFSRTVHLEERKKSAAAIAWSILSRTYWMVQCLKKSAGAKL